MLRLLCGLQEENAAKFLGPWVEDHVTPVLRDGQTTSEVPCGQVRQDHNQKLRLLCISDGLNALYG